MTELHQGTHTSRIIAETYATFVECTHVPDEIDYRSMILAETSTSFAKEDNHGTHIEVIFAETSSTSATHSSAMYKDVIVAEM